MSDLGFDPQGRASMLAFRCGLFRISAGFPGVAKSPASEQTPEDDAKAEFTAENDPLGDGNPATQPGTRFAPLSGGGFDDATFCRRGCGHAGIRDGGRPARPAAEASARSIPDA